MKTYIKNLFLLPALIAALALIPAARVTAQTFTNLHSFTFGDGPNSLILAGNTLYGTASGGGSSDHGTVFALNTDGTDFMTLHSFSAFSGHSGVYPTNSDGAYPVAGLILSSNTLYGTAYEGGSSGDGTVFAVHTDGTGFTTLYSFSADSGSSYSTNSDGSHPKAGLILSDNTLYGTAYGGGSSGQGTVFAVHTDGTGFTTLHSFSAIRAAPYTNSDGAYPVAGLILSSNILYGTANGGGSSGQGTVFAVHTDGTGFTTLHSFTGGGDGRSPQAGLILSSNTLYGTAFQGGSSDHGTVFALNTDGTGFTTLHSFSAFSDGLSGPLSTNSDGASPGGGLILSSNTLYGMAFEGGSFAGGTVFAVNTDGTGFTTLYNLGGRAELILSGHTLYGVSSGGGGLGWGTVFSLSLAPSTNVADVVEGEVSQIVEFRGEFSATQTEDKVEFLPEVNGMVVRIQAQIVAVTETNILVRVPADLVGSQADFLARRARAASELVKVEITVTRANQAPVVIERLFKFIYPYLLLYDQVVVPPAFVPQQILPQYNLNRRLDVRSFFFLGKSEDGMVGVRTLNTSLAFPQPLSLETNLFVFEPNLPASLFREITTPFHIQNLGFGDEGVQFNVSQEGLYIVCVEAGTNSVGPFPAPFQIHLAGNVGLPRKLINGVPEYGRGIRLDTLFNHAAPRPQTLAGQAAGVGQTALFKFGNLVSVSQFAVAVLIPPGSGGFTDGTPIVRSADPATPLSITTPTARTPGCFPPIPGTVIDFTQVPDPMEPDALVADVVVGATLGANDALGPALPLAIPGGAVTSLILDMGSGQEIVDGAGPDFKVFALSGSYTVAVANTPYTSSFILIPGTFSGTQQFDLAGTGLTSARYVRVTAAPTVVLDAVQALNVFADEIRLNEITQNLGPFIHVGRATMTMRRAKAPVTALDPFLQLIAPSGTLFAENGSAFGDDLSQDLSDAAIINAFLPETGFYRFLGKGYDKRPDSQAFGMFFVRLETAGNYDQLKIAVSINDEAGTPAQKNGTISTTRQRDSYLFHASPGQFINIVVNGKGNPPLPNPVLELYDPEDFLIAANDDFPQRGRNAALSLTLPPANFAGTALPNPSTYRLVVSAIDDVASTSPLAVGTAYIRRAASGSYEVKVFTGALTGSTPVGAPRIDSINPSTAAAGTQVTITGTNFSATATSNIVLFESAQATVVTASTTQLVVVVPPGLPAGLASVTVRVGGQTSTAANFQISVLTTRTAAARLNCLSLRFQAAIVRFLGQDYRLELSSLLDTSPPNGELFPLFDPLDFSHASGLLLSALNSSNTIGGSIFLDVPMASDVDRDGVPDFFQISQGVGSTQTQGEYFTDIDDGTVTATWSRVAGSQTGTCRLVLRSTTLGQLPESTNSFELLEYTGPLTYAPGSSNVTGAVQFVQTQSSSNTLAGPIQLTRSPTNRLNELRFSSGRWTNAIGRTLSYNSGALQRVSVSSSNYFASLQFLDGDLATTDADYYDWVLSIRDSNDVNGNGVPDLSDDPSVGSVPVFTRPRVEAGQIVLEWQGAGRLQSAGEVTGPWADVIEAASPFRQTPVGARQYFRIAP
jgi:uncharacterized repeat protein (TIGR03803 family)